MGVGVGCVGVRVGVRVGEWGVTVGVGLSAACVGVAVLAVLAALGTGVSVGLNVGTGGAVAHPATRSSATSELGQRDMADGIAEFAPV